MIVQDQGAKRKHYRFTIIRNKDKPNQEVIQQINFGNIKLAYEHMTRRDRTREFTHKHYNTVCLHIKQEGAYTDHFSNGFYWEIRKEYVY